MLDPVNGCVITNPLLNTVSYVITDGAGAGLVAHVSEPIAILLVELLPLQINPSHKLIVGVPADADIELTTILCSIPAFAWTAVIAVPVKDPVKLGCDMYL